jgi:hypothetical protein
VKLFQSLMLLPALLLLVELNFAQAPPEKAKAPQVFSPQNQNLISRDIKSACQVDNKFTLELALKKLASRIDFNQINQVDKLLADHTMPSLQSLFITVRLPKVPYSTGSAAPANSPIELRLVAVGFRQYIDEMAKAMNKQVVVDESPIPDTYQRFENRLQACETLDQNLASLLSIENYLQHFLLRGKKDFKKYISSLDKNDPLNRTTDCSAQLKKLRVINVENALRLRIYRLENAIADLAKQETDTKRRIEAALVLAVDGIKVPKQLDLFGDRFEHQDLKDPELPKLLGDMIKEAGTQYRSEIELASNLYTGMQYWLAGRFGYASSFGGLVKLAYTFTDATDQGELYMSPLPYLEFADQVSSGSEIPPRFERRHLYLHRYPTRILDCKRYVLSTPSTLRGRYRVPSPEKKGDEKKTKSDYYTKPAASYFGEPAEGYFVKAAKPYFIPPAAPYYRKPGGSGKGFGDFLPPASPYYVSPADPYDVKPSEPKQPRYPGSHVYIPVSPSTPQPYQPGVSYGCEIENQDPYAFRRAVGFYEYQFALHYLDYVGSKATTEQRKAIDAILGERLGFKVAILIPQQNNGSVKIRQSGLAWMTALARVELGAMLAALTSDENTFAQFPPAAFDRPQFKALMQEGWRTHLQQIKQNKTLYPKPLTTNGNQALLQDQHLRLVVAWAQALIALSGRSTDTQALHDDLKALQQIREKLTAEFAERVQKVTGAPVIIHKEKIKQ